MNRTYWKIHLDCSKEKSAKKLLNLVIKQLGNPPLNPSLQPYSKGGFMVTFELSHSNCNSYSQLVVEAIQHGQKLGGGWLINGNILDDISAVLSTNTGSKSFISGLDWAEWQLFKIR